MLAQPAAEIELSTTMHTVSTTEVYDKTTRLLRASREVALFFEGMSAIEVGSSCRNQFHK